MRKQIAEGGYPSNAVEVEAFQMGLHSLVVVERLIASAEKRLETFFKHLEKISKGSAETFRSVAEKEIAAKATAPQAS